MWVATDGGSEHVSENLMDCMSELGAAHGFAFERPDGRHITVSHPEHGSRTYELMELQEAA
jgi:hypothetical protein